MAMISYWKDEEGNSPTPFYNNTDDGASYIYGWFSYKGKDPFRAIGIYYDNYPYVKRDDGVSVLAPLVLPYPDSAILLQGLLNTFMNEKRYGDVGKVAAALAFLLKDEK